MHNWIFNQLDYPEDGLVPVRSDPSAPEASLAFGSGFYEASELDENGRVVARGRVFMRPCDWAVLKARGWVLTWCDRTKDFPGAMFAGTNGDDNFQYEEWAL